MECSRLGDRSPATSSALPSSDIDSRTLEEGVESLGRPILSGHEDGKVGMEALSTWSEIMVVSYRERMLTWEGSPAGCFELIQV